MWLKQVYVRGKIWLEKTLLGKEARPKIPRKKLELQIVKATEYFNDQLDQLEEFLSQTDLDNISKNLGDQIFWKGKDFKNLYLPIIGVDRVVNMRQSFVHPFDYSVWILTKIKRLTEEIYYYLQTVEG